MNGPRPVAVPRMSKIPKATSTAINGTSYHHLRFHMYLTSSPQNERLATRPLIA
jgi:hypothetical protein